MLAGLVLGAIGFALSSQTTSYESSIADDDLEQKTWDALEALDEMWHPAPEHGHSMLSYLIWEAANGDPTLLADAMDAFMPPGGRTNVYLHNGVDRLPLDAGSSPPGASIGIAFPVETPWRGVHGSTDLGVYDAAPTEQTLGHAVVPVFNTNLLRDPGLLVQASANGTLTWTPGFADDEDPPPGAGTGKPFEETAYTSLVQGDESHHYPAASVHLECERGEGLSPCYATDLTQDPLDGYGPKDQELDGDGVPVRSKLGFTVDNAGPGPVPAGTSLTVKLPVGLDVDGTVEDGGAAVPFDEASIRIDDERTGTQTVTARLEEDLDPGQKATLDAWLTRTDDRYAYKHVHASLSGGAVSSSQLLALVEDKPADTYTGGDARTVLVSTPRPAGSGAAPEARWGLVVPTPVGDTEIPEASLELQEGSVKIQGASFPDDFDPVHPESPVTDGELSTTPDRVAWTKPGHTSDAYGFLELQFNITTDATAVPASPTFPPIQPQVDYPGFEAPRLSTQPSPGLWWAQHPPDDDGRDLQGYPAPSVGPDHVVEATTDLRHRNVDLDGTSPYGVAPFTDTSDPPPPETASPALADAVHASTVNATPHQAGPGDTVSIDVNATPLLRFLDEHVGADQVTVTTVVETPSSLLHNEAHTTYEHEIDAQELTLDPAIVTHEVPTGSLYGARLAYAQATWETTDTNGDPVQQSARVHDTFEIASPTGPRSLSPTYSLDVIAWMDDW